MRWDLRRPMAVLGTLAGVVTAVLRRMEGDYESRDDFRPATLASMYGTYTATAAAFTWAARRRVWPFPLPAGMAMSAGALMATLGTGVSLAGASRFQSASQLSGTEPGSLHTGGIHRYTRNPQYLGLGLLATGIAIGSRSAFAGLLAAGTWTVYRRWIPSEERHLHRMFGNHYTRYSQHVNRWFGRSQGHVVG